jgi:hypothetical protein
MGSMKFGKRVVAVTSHGRGRYRVEGQQLRHSRLHSRHIMAELRKFNFTQTSYQSARIYKTSHTHRLGSEDAVANL